MTAPGINQLEGKSTLVGTVESTRKRQEAGFEKAMADMTSNLEQALNEFVLRVKQERVAEVSYRQGYSGGGGALGSSLLVLLLLAIPLVRRRS